MLATSNDGLLKMMLYSNLENVTIGEKSFISMPVMRLTSVKITGEIASDSEIEHMNKFFQVNNFSMRQREFLQELFTESIKNRFRIVLGKG